MSIRHSDYAESLLRNNQPLILEQIHFKSQDCVSFFAHSLDDWNAKEKANDLRRIAYFRIYPRTNSAI